MVSVSEWVIEEFDDWRKVEFYEFLVIRLFSMIELDRFGKDKFILGKNSDTELSLF